MALKISAIVCTFNRVHYLRGALQSLANQTLPKEQYEVIVVDNRSTDATATVTKEDFATISNLRYMHEPVLGLSQARNTGWRIAKGKYIAYLDDDAIADRQWLAKIVDVFEGVKPMPGSVGGKVEPIWEAPRPLWLSDAIMPHLATLDWSAIPIFLDHSRWLVGANIAFPRSLLEMVGGFQTNLGRIGTKLLSGEEILMRQQLDALGYGCYYHPDIVVKHNIQASRLTQKWFIDRVYWGGISEAVVQRQLGSLSPAKRLGTGVLTALNMLLSSKRLASWIMPTNDPDRFTLKCLAWGQIGYLLGMLGLVG